MQKRGWIQIVEASISMMILFGLVLGLFQQRIEMPNIGAQVYKIQHQILTEAQEDYCIRNEVLANNTESLNKFIASRLCTLPYNFTTVLCDPVQTCLLSEKPKGDIYADNMIIAANLTNYNPVKIAFFAWQGSTECQSYECNITSQSGGTGGITTCDGSAIGTLRACYSGAPATRNVGICKDGTQTCQSSGAWSTCSGEQLPISLATLTSQYICTYTGTTDRNCNNIDDKLEVNCGGI